MGYHPLGRNAPVRALLDPSFHFRTALALLAEFAERYQLDVTREFEPVFRCWNTGAPDGKTFDPGYAAKGLKRMEVYRAMAVSASGPQPSKAAG